jgi:hypothetical protein
VILLIKWYPKQRGIKMNQEKGRAVKGLLAVFGMGSFMLLLPNGGLASKADLSTGPEKTRLTVESLLAQGPGGAQKGQKMGGQGQSGFPRGSNFGDFDIDGNGRVTEEEFNKSRSQRASERAQEGYPMRNIQNAPAFKDMDSNGNGEITPEEFQSFQATRRQQRTR